MSRITSREISRVVGRCRDSSTSRDISRVVGRYRDKLTFVCFFLASNWPSSSVLHSVKQRSKGKSILGCKYGYGIMIWKYASVPIYIYKKNGSG